MTDQPDFLNAVAAFESKESPETIAKRLQTIETKLKKAPPYRFGPRTIDLDLLLYENTILSEERLAVSGERSANNLIIPHPRMHERRFVLEPLCELMDAKQIHPVLGKTWENLLKDTANQRCERIDFVWP